VEAGEAHDTATREGDGCGCVLSPHLHSCFEGLTLGQRNHASQPRAPCMNGAGAVRGGASVPDVLEPGAAVRCTLCRGAELDAGRGQRGVLACARPAWVHGRAHAEHCAARLALRTPSAVREPTRCQSGAWSPRARPALERRCKRAPHCVACVGQRETEETGDARTRQSGLSAPCTCHACAHVDVRGQRCVARLHPARPSERRATRMCQSGDVCPRVRTAFGQWWAWAQRCEAHLVASEVCLSVHAHWGAGTQVDETHGDARVQGECNPRGGRLGMDEIRSDARDGDDTRGGDGCGCVDPACP
jgi:hypothetical protein